MSGNLRAGWGVDIVHVQGFPCHLVAVHTFDAHATPGPPRGGSLGAGIDPLPISRISSEVRYPCRQRTTCSSCDSTRFSRSSFSYYATATKRCGLEGKVCQLSHCHGSMTLIVLPLNDFAVNFSEILRGG